MKSENVVRIVLSRVNEQGETEILLGQRASSKNFPNMWENPGGKIDEGETIREAAVREVEEEIGLEINPDSLEEIIKESEISPKYNKSYNITYFSISISYDSIITHLEKSKTSQWKWFNLENLPHENDLLSSTLPEQKVLTAPSP